MSQEDLLARIVRVLDAEAVPYFLTGSLASSIQGEPRASHDVDVVVAGQRSLVQVLLLEFPPPRYYFDESAAADAITRLSSFNLVDSEEGIKADFWLVDGGPFDDSRMSRRRRIGGPGPSCWISSPEDTILIKLKWSAMEPGSERQYTDALRVYEVNARRLDAAYLEAWVGRLGLQIPWRRLKAEAQPL